MKGNQQDCVVPETPLGRTPKTPIGQAPKTPNMRYSQKREKRVLFAGAKNIQNNLDHPLYRIKVLICLQTIYIMLWTCTK